MDTKISPSWWLSPLIENLDAETKLALLWLQTAHITPCGWGAATLKRFVFETDCQPEALQRAYQALGDRVIVLSEGYWLRDFIRQQLGEGERLMRNNFSKNLLREIPKLPLSIREAILAEYPTLNIGLGEGLSSPTQAQERRGEERRGEEKVRESAERGTKRTSNPINSDRESDAEKKGEEALEEGDTWLDVESIPARHLINESLGRNPRRAFTAQEEHTLANFAQQTDGQISTAQFRALQRYLLASPKYDSRISADFEAVPEGSLLRKRKRYASNVIEDLPNQIDFAMQWASEPEKKEGAAVSSTVIIPEPDFWREAWPMLFDFAPPSCWAAVLDMHKPQILAQIDQLKA